MAEGRIDPLDALRQPEAPVAPNPGFAAQLRRQLEDLLDPTPLGGAVSTTTSAFAPVGQRLRPYIVAGGAGAEAALAWYADVFGAQPVGDIVRDDDGRVGHCELDIAGSHLYLADAYPEYGVHTPDESAGVSLHLEVADVDDLVARAEAAGATVLRPVDDQFYGARAGTIRDPFGHRWQLLTPMGTPWDVAALEADGYHLETVDLGERAAVDRPPTRTEVAAATADAPGVGYFTLGAPDPDRANAFFGALLGWRTHVSGQGFHIENVSPPGGIDGSATEPGVTIFFRVDDAAALAERVRELGGTVLSIATYDSGGSATCLDDQGIPFVLWQPAPGY
jgi:uncharacterized glyoxalase superfamily protein PhnB